MSYDRLRQGGEGIELEVLVCLTKPVRPRGMVSLCVDSSQDDIVCRAQRLILNEVWQAQHEGIMRACAYGWTQFTLPLTRDASPQRFLPYAIAIALTFPHATHSPPYHTPTMISNSLKMKIPLEDRITRTTVIPARLIGAEGGWGNLEI